MPVQKSSDKEKGVKKKSETEDSDFHTLLEQMKLKNDALKKIYEFFEKDKKQRTESEDNTG